MVTEQRIKIETIGFGFSPTPRAAYHFVVTIPRREESMVTVSEHFVYGEQVEDAAFRERLNGDEPLPYPIRPPQTKVEISLYKWQRVAEEVRTDFNRRLRQAGMRASSWKAGENRIVPYLGKELVLLLWSIEDADPSLITNAVANWQGLAPEERWWLYTTVNAATGHAVEGRGKGWRKAIGIAFTENPAVESPYMSRNGAARASGNGTGKHRARREKIADNNSEAHQLPLI